MARIFAGSDDRRRSEPMGVARLSRVRRRLRRLPLGRVRGPYALGRGAVRVGAPSSMDEQPSAVDARFIGTHAKWIWGL